MNMTPKMRADAYSKAFPDWPAPRADDRWLDGMWVLGQDYRGSGYYGAYPPNYLKRVMALFPDAKNVLHLFAGSLPPGPYVRFDLKGGDIDGDAHRISEYFAPNEFDLVLADPPYSIEDAEHYGAPMVRRNTVLKELRAVVRPGGNVVWLDQVLPMFSNKDWHLWGLLGIVRSTNHRFRVVSMFERRLAATLLEHED